MCSKPELYNRRLPREYSTAGLYKEVALNTEEEWYNPRQEYSNEVCSKTEGYSSKV